MNATQICNWLNHIKPYGLANQRCVTFKFTKSWRRRQRLFLRMFGVYGPRADHHDVT